MSVKLIKDLVMINYYNLRSFYYGFKLGKKADFTLTHVGALILVAVVLYIIIRYIIIDQGSAATQGIGEGFDNVG